MERREQVTRAGIALVNWQQDEPHGFGGRRQPSLGGTSRISREAYVRFCERLGVKSPGATRRQILAWQPEYDISKRRTALPAGVPRPARYICRTSFRINILPASPARWTSGISFV